MVELNFPPNQTSTVASDAASSNSSSGQSLSLRWDMDRKSLGESFEGIQYITLYLYIYGFTYVYLLYIYICISIYIYMCVCVTCCFCCFVQKRHHTNICLPAPKGKSGNSRIFCDFCTYIHIHVCSFTCIVPTNQPTYPPKYPIHRNHLSSPTNPPAYPQGFRLFQQPRLTTRYP